MRMTGRRAYSVVEGGGEQRRVEAWNGGASGHHQASRERGRMERSGARVRGTVRPGSSSRVEEENRPSQNTMKVEPSCRPTSRKGRPTSWTVIDVNSADGASKASEESTSVKRAARVL